MGSLPLNEVDAFRKARSKLNFAQFPNWVYIWSTVYVYTMESSWNPNSKTREPDWRQHDRPAVCYRPTVFFRHICLVAFSFPLRKNSAPVSKTLSINFSSFLKISWLWSCVCWGVAVRKTAWSLIVRLWPLDSSTVDEHRKEYRWKKALSLFPRQCTGTHSL